MLKMRPKTADSTMILLAVAEQSQSQNTDWTTSSALAAEAGQHAFKWNVNGRFDSVS
jgi:hypothetical protein